MDYADDIAALDSTEEGLQETTELIVDNCDKASIIITAKKTY